MLLVLLMLNIPTNDICGLRNAQKLWILTIWWVVNRKTIHIILYLLDPFYPFVGRTIYSNILLTTNNVLFQTAYWISLAFTSVSLSLCLLLSCRISGYIQGMKGECWKFINSSITLHSNMEVYFQEYRFN